MGVTNHLLSGMMLPVAGVYVYSLNRQAFEVPNDSSGEDFGVIGDAQQAGSFSFPQLKI